MAGGGWSERGLGTSLRRRLRFSGRAYTAQHCWVTGSADGEPRPGLLIEWRRVPGGWEGLVAYVALIRPQAWMLVQEWLPGEQLTPLPPGRK